MKFELNVTGETVKLDGRELSPDEYMIDKARGTITVFHKARRSGTAAVTQFDVSTQQSDNFFTRQEDEARMQQSRRRSGKRPAWKTPYGPQKR